MIKQGDNSYIQESRRKNLGIPILITRVNDESKGKTFFGYAKNISQGGMFIQSVNPRNVNERFQIEFSLPGEDKPIGGKVEVVWKRQLLSRKSYEPGMGIRFLDMEEDKSAKINNWVESRLEEEQRSLGGALNHG